MSPRCSSSLTPRTTSGDCRSRIWQLPLSICITRTPDSDNRIQYQQLSKDRRHSGEALQTLPLPLLFALLVFSTATCSSRENAFVGIEGRIGGPQNALLIIKHLAEGHLAAELSFPPVFTVIIRRVLSWQRPPFIQAPFAWCHWR